MSNVALKLEGHLAVVTLDRPERRNALSFDLMRDLVQCLDHIASRPEVRAVILASSGKVFSSGHDLGEMMGRKLDDYRGIFDLCTELMVKIQSIPQPIIAQVQGTATAAGCQLVATCDLAVASSDAAFATPGVKIGLFCYKTMVALTRAVGRKRAMEMLLTGRLIDAAMAADWGLVNKVVPPACLEAETRKAGLADRRGEFVHGRARQTGLLQTDRLGSGWRLRVHQGGHVAERHGRRRAGGNLGVSGQAESVLEGKMSFF